MAPHNPTNPSDDLITLTEAKHLLDIQHEKNVRLLVKKGQLVTFTADRRVSRAEVLAYRDRRGAPPHSYRGHP
jgi:hypothetical protein